MASQPLARRFAAEAIFCWGFAETVVGRLFGAGEARRSEELTMLTERVAELQGVEHRVLELEERLDFAERMLARGLPAPGPEADTPPEPVEAAR